MRKWFLILLAGIMLAVIASAGAEYKNYQITEGNWWDCFPLDSHNTVVAARLWNGDSEPDPWYVCWYRDGELLDEIPDSWQYVEPESVDASGGWSRMDYLIKPKLF